MFARLTGHFEALSQDQAVIDVGGVGYLVQCSRKTMAQIGVEAAHVTLLIETNVREDAIQLYGFQTAQEQVWFRLLTSVQGVGAKAGLAILSVCSIDELSLAIASADKAMITRADGVGPKLATRILTELKDKSASLMTSALPGNASMPSTNGQAEGQTVAHDINQDAVSALVNLGYGRGEAYAAVAKLQGQGMQDDIGILIREALKELAA